MERLEELDNLSPEQRIERFISFLAGVAVIDDLFPPDMGVREVAAPPRDPNPNIGKIVLELAWCNPDPPERRLTLVSV